MQSVSDLYDALGGTGTVSYLITYDSQVQEWRSYLGVADRGTPADRRLADDTGILAGMLAPAAVHLTGTPLGTNGKQHHHLNPRSQPCGAALERSKNLPRQRPVHAPRDRRQRPCGHPHR